MSKELLVEPRIYDALSGEFKPPCDPLQRLHTLGRLIVGAYEKGASTGSRSQETLYRPSWAPNIEVYVDSWAVSKQHMLFTGFELRNIHNEYAGLIMRSGPQTLDIGYEVYELSPGDKLTVAKNKATELAQQFFDQNS
jgi:hypothetical protein